MAAWLSLLHLQEPADDALRTQAEILVTDEEPDQLHAEPPWNLVLAFLTPKLLRRILETWFQVHQLRKLKPEKGKRTTNRRLAKTPTEWEHRGRVGNATGVSEPVTADRPQSYSKGERSWRSRSS